MKIALYTNGIILIYSLTTHIDIPAGNGHWSMVEDKILYRDGEFKTDFRLADITEITDESQDPAQSIPLPTDTVGLYDIIKPKRFLFTGSGGSTPTTNTMLIPTPRVKIIKRSTDIRPTIQVKWDSENTTFLAYQPEIWLFAYKPSYRSKETNGQKFNNGKKWVHPTHLEGSKHTGENKYTGRPDTDIEVGGQPVVSSQSYFLRLSEFDLPAQDTWTEINIEPDKYFVTDDASTGEMRILKEVYDNNLGGNFIFGVLNGNGRRRGRNKNMTRLFRFAISIKKNNKYFFSDPSEVFMIKRNFEGRSFNDLILKMV